VKSIRRWWTTCASWLAGIRRLAAAWRWGGPIARAAAAVLGLVVLAAIGRSALARGSSKSADPVPDPIPLSALPEGHPSSVAAPVAPSIVTSPTVALADGTDASPSSASPLADGGSSTVENGARPRATPDDPVYLNQATLSDLRRLPGVGAKRAQAILALRDRIQHFRQIEDLLKVKGIGRSSLRKLRPLVRLDLAPATSDAGGGA
jgi:competence protein ComEA